VTKIQFQRLICILKINPTVIMIKQFILPALVFLFASATAFSQTLTSPEGSPKKKEQTSTSTAKKQPTEARSENNLPKGAKVKKSPTGSKKGKAKGHTKGKAQGKANGHHKGEKPETANGEKHEGEHHNGEKHQEGTEMKKAPETTPAPKKGQTVPAKKSKQPTKPAPTTPTTDKDRSGSTTPASSGN
jgi:hypothetical protein